MEKYIKDGEVAVLYSPEYGAGWVSWNGYDDLEEKNFLAMDKTLVELAMKQAHENEVIAYLETIPIFEDNMPYMGGWSNIQVMFLPEGTCFEITEYDGFESITTRERLTQVA